MKRHHDFVFSGIDHRNKIQWRLRLSRRNSGRWSVQSTEQHHKQQHKTNTDAISTVSKDARLNAQQIGVMGKSLSGAHAVYMAVTDDRVKAALSTVPHIKASKGVVGTRVQFLEDIASDMQAKATGGKRTMVQVFGPLGTKAIMTTEGAQAYLATLLTRSNYKNGATASSMLDIAGYVVSLKAKDIKIPILVATANQDTITPPSAVPQAYDGQECSSAET